MMSQRHEELPPCTHCGAEADWVDEMGAICNKCLTQQEDASSEEAQANAEMPCNCDQALALQAEVDRLKAEVNDLTVKLDWAMSELQEVL